MANKYLTSFIRHLYFSDYIWEESLVNQTYDQNSWLHAVNTLFCPDAELLEDFHEYVIEQDDAEEWNKNQNPDGDKGLFSKADYYYHTYNSDSEIAQQDSYHSDFTDYLMDNQWKRSFLELRFGVDFYVENLKFTLYGEHPVWKRKFLYNNLFTVGLSASIFIY